MSSQVLCLILLNLNLFLVGIFGKVYLTTIFRVKNIGLYFFTSEKKRSERYIALVKFMRSKDLVMRMLINDVELFILASTTLCSDSQNVACWDIMLIHQWIGVVKNVILAKG